MTEDMPTVDGARAALTAAALVDLYWTTTGDTWAIPEDVMVKFGRAVEARLAPTVAALEAEVARQTARADAAEAERDALQERVRRTIAAIDADVVLYRPDATDGREGA